MYALDPLAAAGGLSTAGLNVLADNNFGDTRTGGLAGPLGLFLVLLLVIATVLLIRNMNARIRRLPDRFPDQTPPSAKPQNGNKESRDT